MTYKISEQQEEYIISYALELIKNKFKPGKHFSSPLVSTNYLQLKYSQYEHEVFGVLFLTNKHNLIAEEIITNGTIDGANVHIRVIAQKALQHNAAAIILFHNHPSGNAEPSAADIHITRKIKDSISIFDITVLDHIIISTQDTYSLAEKGKM